ncbi:hypothetical protein LY78DRAFT_668300 [Colletotrichum sublineola]|uniref:Uncharacterized protein n=1 Tax=Colletotrichum sublineola TaxID=1173701 RepID=A0A066XSE9_COLSU|nr:hypothetical protein LY78DRAFT_668300 [Colletotrichum sublineola]KDN71772.1 hypothetical protein CSUB01_02668 [Colletotrichum sublineola]
MSSIRALRLQSAMRASTLRPVQRTARRTFAAQPTPSQPASKQPGSDQKAPTSPDQLSNRSTIFLIAGIAVAIGGAFAFLTGAPDRAAGVVESSTRGSNGSALPGYGSKPSSEQHLEATTGRDSQRQSGLAGLKSEQTDPNQAKAKN